MSHISMFETDLVMPPLEQGTERWSQPAWQLLREAFAVVAEEYGGQVIEHISDYFGRRTSCPVAVQTPTFPPGIGIRVDESSGAVSFVADGYGYDPVLIQELQDRLVQVFSILAITRAMNELHYDVEVCDDESHPNRKDPRTVWIQGVM